MPTSRGPRPLLTLTKALGSLLLLAALIVGVPVALIHLSPLVWSHGGSQVLNLLDLDQQDSGGLALLLLLALAWAGWAQFTVAVLLEVPAQLRGRAARRRRSLGFAQGAAASLIGAVLVLLPTSTALATPAVASPITATAATVPGADDAGTGTEAVERTEAAGRVYTVRSAGESLLEIARAQLGDEERFVEIAALNEGRTMPDGTRFSADRFLRPGWQLLLPAGPDGAAGADHGGVRVMSAGPDAGVGEEPLHTVADDRSTLRSVAEDRLGSGARWQHLANLNPSVDREPDQPLVKGTTLRLPEDASAGQPTATRDDAAAAPGERERAARHTVEAGETLWEISESYLGDGTRYQEVFEANQPEISDPDLIYPGQKVLIPSVAAQQPDQQDADETADEGAPKKELDKKDVEKKEADKAVPPADSPERPDSDRAEGAGNGEKSDEGGGEAESAAPRETGGGEQSVEEARPGPQVTGPAHSGGRDAAESAPAAASSADRTPVVIGAAAGLLAAGLLSSLYVRRVVQQRRRRRGRRIAMPEGRAVQTEESLRTAAAPIDPAVLDGVLRRAAFQLAADGRALPALQAVVLGGHEVELHLVAGEPPVAPFRGEDGDQRWVCSLTAAADEELDVDVDSPYPGLVVLGTLPDQRLVLVDLEHIGLLRLTGPGRHAVARTLAVEFTVTQLAEHLSVLLPEDLAPGLAGVSERVTACPSPTKVLEQLRAHHGEQQRALEALELRSLREARLGEAGAGGWTPQVVIADEWPADQEEELARLVRTEPRTATAVVTTSAAGSDTGPGEGWVLETTDASEQTVQLPGTGLMCTLAALDDASYQDIITMLATADTAQDVPAADAFLPAYEAPTEGAGAGTATDTPPADFPAVEVPAQEEREHGPAASGAALMSSLAALDDDVPQEEESDPRPSAQAVASASDGVSPAEATDSATSGGKEPTFSATAVPDLSALAPALPAPVPSATPPESADPAVEEERTGGPQVRVLGPVELCGARGTVETKRARAATELVAWLWFHPGRSREAIETALWRDRPVKRRTVTELVSRTRAWLGTNEDGEYYLPIISDTADARYTLAGVDSDWRRFQELVESGSRLSGDEGTEKLKAALRLVRGTPFSGVPPNRYVWAEPLLQEMIAAIVDAAEILAERHLVAGRAREALWAAAQGLQAAPEAEQLHRARFTALAALGDFDGLRKAADELEQLNEALGVEAEEETMETLRALLARA
ncbi:LysM peptidoglycan-binding domain-containing protein [Streptomyces alkaliterrae]|uniref:LysM peptidoglycan-binding domain-containing protein n=1 Tax=Streptomyces alkaliterrae TaxID=2213162 RepID=A0A5P0YK61_9ACTN|nr:LysM peptidoglycan-binding domain-containing protein [Streptomyces alkaliterrae]MBB1258332.1 LysM peptidoglycan-binding domain-containing protein [Streptomyces alkaliterrae]MQS00686.1 LysM peptidoglycan-binding domain-containing protein [Streptomyces alkaliterrae]